MEEKDNRKRSADQIKIISASKVDTSNSDSDTSTKVPRKNNARTGVLELFQPQMGQFT